ncbi:hypothetical protein ACS0TY_018494 [Phlomoides rotata]
MADETVINGEFPEDQTVEISGDENSSKISSLTLKISDLERENGKIIRENDDYKQQIEELKESIKELSNENDERKKQLDKAESENRTLGVVAARAAELEGEVSRLQHDLVSATSDLQDTTGELSGLKKELEGVKKRETENDAKLIAITKERDLLLSKFEKLNEVEISLRDESASKEKEISSLKKSLEELEVVVESSKVLEKLKKELEKTIENLKGRISVLETSLDEKQKVISGFEMKKREVEENVNGDDALIDGEKKGAIGGLKQRDWVVVGGSTIAAVAVVGVVCYMHAAKKH